MTERFPDRFLWGASTSAYQIEGAVREDGRGPSIWDIFSHQPGNILGEDTGDIACDHYHRWPEDIALMRDLGIAAYRFSIAWPRVLPQGRGGANPKGLDFYDRLIDALLKDGIEPWICLYHWDLPQALDDLGGWQTRDIAGWFADYAALVASRYGDRVKRFATFNEPSVFALFGYGWGWNAPAIADRAAFFQASHHVNLAHGAAVDVLRSMVPQALIGAVHNRQPCIPCSQSPEDVAASVQLDACWNLIFPDPEHFAAYPAAIEPMVAPFVKAGDMARICRPVDWFGVNHYGPIYAKADSGNPLGFAMGPAPEQAAKTEIGWPIHPDAFRDELIATYRRYRLPIYVTENGCGGDDKPDAGGKIADRHRVEYLAGYTKAMQAAIDHGADVRGYFVWSLLDNFEWGSGYANRFGLVYVDFASQKRIPKASADWYRRHIAGSGANHARHDFGTAGPSTD